MAPVIVAAMRPHGAYVEPFAGSLAVLLSKTAVPVEVVNDQNEMLITFYRVLRDPDMFRELEHLIRLTPYSRQEMLLAMTDDPALPMVERVRRFFVRINQAYVSSNGQGSFTVTYQSSAQHSNASKWTRFQERLWAVRARLEGVQLECMDALDVLARMTKKDREGVVYVDPPYLSKTRNSTGNSMYSHDMSTPAEHEKLAEELHRLAGTGRQVLVSGYACTEYDEWYKGWEVVTFASTKTGRPGQGSRSQQEVLWVSPEYRRKIPR